MKKYLSGVLAAATVAAGLSVLTVAPANAGTVNAVARVSDTTTCTKVNGVGVTQRRIALKNPASNNTRVQFRIFMDNDALLPANTYKYVRPGETKYVYSSVRHNSSQSVRIRVPENSGIDQRRLVLVETHYSAPKCYVAHTDPKATLGGITCVGTDSVIQVQLDNRGTTDDAIEYQVESATDGSTSSQTTLVAPKQIRNVYVEAAQGSSAQVTVTVDGEVLMDEAVASKACA